MENTHAPYAKVVVKLLQGAIYNENEELWNDLLLHQVHVSQYFDKIAIDLVVERKDGYAYLKQSEIDEEGTTIGLMRRMPIQYELSLLLVLLRKLMDDFEGSNTEQRNLYISHKRIKEELEIFFKETSNKVKLIRELDSYIKKAEELDFLKRINKETAIKDEIQYEVRRIIKAKITNDVLEDFKRKLQKDV